MTITAREALLRLAEKEGWEPYKKLVEKADGATEERLFIQIEDKELRLTDPYTTHLRIYRDCSGVDTRVQSMRRITELLWPDYQRTWNTWMERIYTAHCSGEKEIVLAGGAGVSKSFCAALCGIIFYLARYREVAVVVASTTLDGLEKRIWGYIAKLLSNTAIPTTAKILRSKPPKVVYPGQADRIHGMIATAIQQGEDNKVLAGLIGQHPDWGIMVILDEATDMNPAILSAIPNLEKGIEFCQVWSIGNSSSYFDLHGSMATPELGWESIDPFKHEIWKTKRQGICLYFNPFNSPAITETDPVKKILLSKFLPTEEGIKKDTIRYGEGSDSYMRFVMGFWKSKQVDGTILSEAFLNEYHVSERVEWSGLSSLEMCAGLDIAFQAGGTGCILRLGVVGINAYGQRVIDFCANELLFRIEILVSNDLPAEHQLAKNTLDILRRFGIPVRHLAIDATGVGRAMGSLISLLDGNGEQPIRIVSTRTAQKKGETDPFIMVKSPSDLWMEAREYIQRGQIKGVDNITLMQLGSRQVKLEHGKLVLESKKEYKDRMAAIMPSLAHSPDEADGMILSIQSAKYGLNLLPGQLIELPKVDPIQQFYNEKMKSAQLEKLKAEEVKQTVSARPSLGRPFSQPLERLVRGRG